jgi:uncharacterized protein (UPF0261 family)
LRIPPPRQLELICNPTDGPGPNADVWVGLPEATREAYLSLLKRLTDTGLAGSAVELIELDATVNDEKFADAMVDRLHAAVAQHEGV